MQDNKQGLSKFGFDLMNLIVIELMFLLGGFVSPAHCCLPESHSTSELHIISLSDACSAATVVGRQSACDYCASAACGHIQGTSAAPEACVRSLCMLHHSHTESGTGWPHSLPAAVQVELASPSPQRSCQQEVQQEEQEEIGSGNPCSQPPERQPALQRSSKTRH